MAIVTITGRLEDTRAIGRCRYCKAGVAVTVRQFAATRTTEFGDITTRRFKFMHEVAAPTHHRVARATCGSCGAACTVEVVNVAHDSDHTCSARCTNATGPSCSCSCNGANHGAAHG